MDSLENACTYCSELSGQTINNYLLMLAPDIENRVIFETTNFVSMPTIGHMTLGYLLIIPKTHFLSFGHLSKRLLLEYEDFSMEIRQYLIKEFNSVPIFFEHGPISESKRGGCCVDHAHMHVVPSRVDLLTDLENNFDGRKINSVFDLGQQIDREMPYLYYENTIGEKYVFDAPKVKSQYLRILLAEKLGIAEEWDWLLFPKIENLRSTLTKLRKYRDKV